VDTSNPNSERTAASVLALPPISFLHVAFGSTWVRSGSDSNWGLAPLYGATPRPTLASNADSEKWHDYSSCPSSIPPLFPFPLNRAKMTGQSQG